MAAGKALRSRTLPHAMDSSPQPRRSPPSQVSPSQAQTTVSPVARERARLRDLARKGKQIGGQQAGGPVRASHSQLDFVADTEQQDEVQLEGLEDAQEPFQSELEQAQGLMSMRQLINKSKLLDADFRRNEDSIQNLTRPAHSVQTALNELGVDSQLPVAVSTSSAGLHQLPDCSPLSQEDSGSETEDPREQEESEEGEESSEESEEGEESSEESEEGEEGNSDPPTPDWLSRPVYETQATIVTEEPVEVPIEVLTTESDKSGQAEMDDVHEVTAEEALAGRNPKAPRQFIPRPHVMALVSYYEKVFAAYCKSIAPKKPSQLVPNKVWKDVWAAYRQNFPNSVFKEESLKEPLRQQLRDLAKEKEKPDLNPEHGVDPSQDEELLARLMATESWRAKGLLQERLNVADRVSSESGKKKKSESARPTTPGTPAAGSSQSGQTSTKIGSIGERHVGKNGTKSQNLKDAKEGIHSMLGVMTSMNDEKKLENTRKRQLAEGKAALHEAKRRESEERSSVLAAQRNALDEQAKMNRIALLKEQKNIGLIDDQQFAEACKVVFYS